MKNRILCLVGGVAFMIAACTPIEDRQAAGPIVPASEFSYTITNDPTNDYILYLENMTPEVMFSWDYAWGVTRKQHDTVRMLVPGTYTVKITATTAGGIVTDEKTITVTKSDPSAFQEPEWGYLTNLASGKTWVWDDTQPAPWGNGGYRGCTAPCWWAVSMADINGRGVGSDEMTFDLNGGRNLTLKAASTPAAYAGTTKGSFDLSFDVGRAGWDVGKLTTTNVTVINGVQVNFSNQIEDEFYILKLTDSQLVLSAPEPGVTGDWGTAWFWMFKPKSK
jgi:PKD repeat protein